jgi:hypothetical protein
MFLTWRSTPSKGVKSYQELCIPDVVQKAFRVNQCLDFLEVLSIMLCYFSYYVSQGHVLIGFLIGLATAYYPAKYIDEVKKI